MIVVIGVAGVTFVLLVILPWLRSIKQSVVNYFILGFIFGYRSGYCDKEQNKPIQFRTVTIPKLVEAAGNIKTLSDIKSLLVGNVFLAHDNLKEAKLVLEEQAAITEISAISMKIVEELEKEVCSDSICNSLLSQLNLLILNDLAGNFLSNSEDFSDQHKQVIKDVIISNVIRKIRENKDFDHIRYKKEQSLFLKHLAYISIMMNDMDSAKELLEHSNAIIRS